MSEFAQLLKTWRSARDHSQLSLSSLTGVSQRYLSYLETDKSHPSRAMIVTLCDALDVPFSVRNRMLRSCDYATIETNSHSVFSVQKQQLDKWVQMQAQVPAVLVDELWNIESYNPGLTTLLNLFGGARMLLQQAEFEGRPNLFALFYLAASLCTQVKNGSVIGRAALAKLFRQAQLQANDSNLNRLLRHINKGQFGNEGWWQLDEPDHSIPGELLLSHNSLQLSFAVMQSATQSEDAYWQIFTFLPLDDVTKSTLGMAC